MLLKNIKVSTLKTAIGFTFCSFWFTRMVLTEDDKLFSDIFNNMKGRATNPGKLGTASLAFGIDDMEVMKKNQVVVEFVYSKPKNIKVYSQNQDYLIR
jgi:hypothetical protein